MKTNFVQKRLSFGYLLINLNRLTHRLINGLTLLFLLVFLTACAAQQTSNIPSTLLLPTKAEVDPKDLNTNGDLLEYSQQLNQALLQCNADKESIKKLLQ